MDALLSSLQLWHSMKCFCSTETPSPRFRLWFFMAVGHPICHAIPTSFGMGRHSYTALSFPCRNSPHSIWGCFLLPAWPWVSCASSLPKQMSFSPRLCTYNLIIATAASPQLTSVDGYLPLPHLMTSGLYCSRKEGNWEDGNKGKRKFIGKIKWKRRKEKG